jgi:hypothetical protein
MRLLAHQAEDGCGHNPRTEIRPPVVLRLQGFPRQRMLAHGAPLIRPLTELPEYT